MLVLYCIDKDICYFIIFAYKTYIRIFNIFIFSILILTILLYICIYVITFNCIFNSMYFLALKMLKDILSVIFKLILMYSMTVNVIFPIFTLNKYSFIHSFGTYIDSFNRGINLKSLYLRYLISFILCNDISLHYYRSISSIIDEHIVSFKSNRNYIIYLNISLDNYYKNTSLILQYVK